MAVNKELKPDQFAKTAKNVGIISFFFGVIYLSLVAIKSANYYKKQHDGQHCKESFCGFICGILSLILWIALICVGLYFGLK